MYSLQDGSDLSVFEVLVIPWLFREIIVDYQVQERIFFFNFKTSDILQFYNFSHNNTNMYLTKKNYKINFNTYI